jgi:hypothetical protein
MDQREPAAGSPGPAVDEPNRAELPRPWVTQLLIAANVVIYVAMAWSHDRPAQC